MPEVPLLRPVEVVAAFRRLGWEVARRRGSHIILTRPGHIATLSVPNHPQVARGTLRSLIQMSGVGVGEFLRQVK
ncbi:MAG: type II toxin-antitoxin system HicA family toxin [Armatimonadota bacterium]|nr:type II toxin-antitoxin system HicA family toxin [Armatimonadota bacterium]